MNKLITKTFATTVFGCATLVTLLLAHAQLRSKSGEIVVVEPRNLSEEAQLGGNSFFLHADSSGTTYLYVEQQRGARLTVFDVTDPSHVKTIASTPLTVSGPFDFVRPLDGHAELIRFRDGKTVGVLDLSKASKPSIHIVSALVDPGRRSLWENPAF